MRRSSGKRRERNEKRVEEFKLKKHYELLKQIFSITSLYLTYSEKKILQHIFYKNKKENEYKNDLQQIKDSLLYVKNVKEIDYENKFKVLNCKCKKVENAKKIAFILILQLQNNAKRYKIHQQQQNKV